MKIFKICPYSTLCYKWVVSFVNFSSFLQSQKFMKIHQSWFKFIIFNVFNRKQLRSICNQWFASI